jgi:uncharacterized membrane protein YjfL (UPF0719 family)
MTVMSGDEVFVALASGALALFAWLGWYLLPMRVERLGAPARGLEVLVATPPLAAAILYAVLRTAASHDVREDPIYLGFYLVMGAAWLGLGARCFPLLGVSPRDDVVERGNRAAAHAIGGALVAVMLCFAGGNIGDGPGWWVVVFSAALATATLLLLWLALDLLSGISDTVTVERDAAAGVRLAGFLVACGLILGRAVAGDWVSAGATARDFVLAAWPVLPLLAVAALAERRARPTPERPAPSPATHGTLPALLYVAVAALHVLRLGAPA